MRVANRPEETEEVSKIDEAETQVLTTSEERVVLAALAEAKRKLADALARVRGAEFPAVADDPQSLAHYIHSLNTGDGAGEARLGAIFRTYNELRSKLALANVRLVAHVAKRYRDRGVAYSDLLQEGFCGLLEAIDRFDLGHETKLATYATWWIRQSVQKAVAEGAYAVRLSPRHLRQLAQNQEEIGKVTNPGGSQTASPEMIHRIHAATRPSVSLDAAVEAGSGFSLLQTLTDPEGDRTVDVDTGETVTKLIAHLRPREKEVLNLRYGLSGEAPLSLSQVGKVLEISKERVRQIQDRAMEKLRIATGGRDVSDFLVAGA